MLHLGTLSVLACSVTLLAPLGFGQGFESERLLQFPRSSALTFEDVNGDGELDMLSSFPSSAAFDPDTFLWSENLGSMRFGGWQFSEDGASITSPGFLGRADLDGDGDQDIVLAGSATSLGWMENLGSVQFAPYGHLAATSNNAGTVQVKDLDGDGDLDIFTTINAGFGLSIPAWFENLGSMTFAPQVLLGTAARIVDLVSLDVDGDGQLDLIWKDRNSHLTSWARNTGQGFAASQVLHAPPADHTIHARADVDGDGDMDLMGFRIQTSSTPQAALVWYENQGVLQFSGPQFIEQISFYDTTDRLGLADMESDGDLDVFIVNGLGLFYFEALGMGQFAPKVSIGGITNNDPNEYVTNLIVRDVDEDGDLDIVTVSDQIRWAENQGDGTFTGIKTLTFSMLDPWFPKPKAKLIDFDLDGDLDLMTIGQNVVISAWDTTYTIELSKNRGDGRFESSQRAPSPINPTDFVMLDADGDGDMGMAVFSEGDGTFNNPSHVTFYPNVGAGGPAVPQQILGQLYSAMDFGGYLFVGDADADGDEDLLAVHFPGEAQWILNTGGGNFQPLGVWNIPQHGRIVLVDLDGDGDDDVASLEGNRLIVHTNLGGGNMGGVQVLSSFPNVSAGSLEAVDIEGDGDMDLLILRTIGSQVYLYENAGNGQFAAPQLQAVTAQNSRVVLGRDLNFDGNIDLLVFSAEETNWFENLGGSIYGAPVDIPQNDVFSSTVWAAAEDLDGDLDWDLIKATDDGISTQHNNLHFGKVYCDFGSANSTGDLARMWAEGSPLVTNNNLTLAADRLPPNQIGFFVVGTAPEFVPFPGGSQGWLCIGGAIGRLNRGAGEIFNSGNSGQAAVSLDLCNVPTPFGPETMLAGTTRYFQAWFRDQNPGNTSNFTWGLSVTFE